MAAQGRGHATRPLFSPYNRRWNADLVERFNRRERRSDMSAWDFVIVIVYAAIAAVISVVIVKVLGLEGASVIGGGVGGGVAGALGGMLMAKKRRKRR
jgi:L-cystine uptake protein TcyP (sodium:dicarboxylate symporter family)